MRWHAGKMSRQKESFLPPGGKNIWTNQILMKLMLPAQILANSFLLEHDLSLTHLCAVHYQSKIKAGDFKGICHWIIERAFQGSLRGK